jgi:hypothetical protein
MIRPTRESVILLLLAVPCMLLGVWYATFYLEDDR